MQLAGRTSVKLMAPAGSHLPGQGLGAVAGARTSRLSGVAATKGAQLEEERGQAMRSHPFHRTMGSCVWGCSGHSPAPCSTQHYAHSRSRLCLGNTRTSPTHREGEREKGNPWGEPVPGAVSGLSLREITLPATCSPSMGSWSQSLEQDMPLT